MANNTVPKPWQHKDAYIIGDGKIFSVTLALQGETNKKIDKAPIVYQITNEGQWTDISNVELVDVAKEPIDKAPTFQLEPADANRILDGKPVDVNWTRGLDVYLLESGNKVMMHQVPHEALMDMHFVVIWTTNLLMCFASISVNRLLNRLLMRLIA